MTKKWNQKFFLLACILLIFSIGGVIFFLNTENTDIKVNVKLQLHIKPTLGDLESTTLYRKFKNIKLSQSVLEVEESMKLLKKVSDIGMLKEWETKYGRCSILFENSKVISKTIKFNNLPVMNITKQQYDSIKKGDTLEDVQLKLGNSFAFDESILGKNEQIDSYMWVVKDKFDKYDNISNFKYKGHTLVIQFSKNIVYDIKKY